MKNYENYEEVSGWIKSINNPDSIKHIVQFIENSHVSKLDAEDKAKLLKEVDVRQHELAHMPYFCPATNVLLNTKGLPAHYSNKIAAIWKLAELKLRGYNVQIGGVSGLHTIQQVIN